MNKFWQKYKVNIIIYLVLVVLVTCTLFFSAKMTYLLKLKPVTPSKDVLSVHFVDVGQGSCTLIHFASGEDMLIDSGPSSANKKLLNYIDNVFFENGDKVFEYVILTHSDSDHSGNMSSIISSYGITNFYRPNIISTLAGETGDPSESYIDNSNKVYAQVIKDLKAKSGINVVFSVENTTITSGDKTLLTMYSPQEGYVYDNVNDYSPIMVFGEETLKVCVTGDASKSVETIVNNNYTLPDIDVLCLGHHGSKTSTAYDFVEALQPEYAVISVGKNSYGHPSSETYQTLMQYDDDYSKHTYDNKQLTQDKGNIIFYSSNSKYSIMYITNVDNYLFVEYWLIVLIVDASLLLIMIKPITNKYSKNVRKVRKNVKVKPKTRHK